MAKNYDIYDPEEIEIIHDEYVEHNIIPIMIYMLFSRKYWLYF